MQYLSARGLKIMAGPQDITGDTAANAITVITGEAFNLHTEASPRAAWPPKGTSFSWSVPAPAYYWYVTQPRRGELLPITTNRSYVAFFWSDAGDHTNPNSKTAEHISVSVDGSTLSTVISAVKPIATVTGTLQAVNIVNAGYTTATGGFLLGHLGPHNLNKKFGSDHDGAEFFSSSRQVSTVYTGSWFWLQTASFDYGIQEINGQWHHATPNGLDSKTVQWPNGTIDDTWDPPYNDAQNDKSKQITVTGFAATMYLMFAPSIANAMTFPVPVRYVPWNWSGSATAANKGARWVKGTVTPTAETTLFSTLGTSPPEWTSNNQPLAWSPPIVGGDL